MAQMFHHDVVSDREVFLIVTHAGIMILCNHQNRLKNKYVEKMEVIAKK